VRPAAEVRAELGLATGDELVVNVARFVELKNQALLLDALADVAAQRPRLHAVLIGDGPLREQLERQADRLGIADRVQIQGFRPDAVDVTAAADVFALSSDTEALPLTVLEAMTYGRPIVSTGVGSIPDTIADGVDGLIVPRGGRSELAAAIERLLEDRAFAERLGAHARGTIEARYSVDRMVGRTLAAYASAVARRGRERMR
jgi:glycosyltransferase involved in cell wall biosynthesis